MLEKSITRDKKWKHLLSQKLFPSVVISRLLPCGWRAPALSFQLFLQLLILLRLRVLSSFEVIIITPSIIIKNPEHHNNRPLSIRIHCFGWHRIH
jgi:hypothetical protein